MKGITTEEIEKRAIQIHNESENQQKKLYAKVKLEYVILPWDDFKDDGFYKKNVRMLAARQLEEQKNVKKTKPNR